jgi:hypothetical protein
MPQRGNGFDSNNSNKRITRAGRSPEKVEDPDSGYEGLILIVTFRKATLAIQTMDGAKLASTLR